MANNLDNIELMKKIDPKNMLLAMQQWPEQIERCWSDWQKIAIPTHYVNAKNVLILGIGGSGIGAAITTAYARRQSAIFIDVARDYTIPSWVDKNTLVIAVSFSGNTEETLAAFKAAASKTDKLITVSTGGALSSLGSSYKALRYEYSSDSPQPRQALGFSLTALLAILAKLRIIDLKTSDIEEAMILLKGLLKKIDADVPVYRNQAKIIAQKLVNRIPIVLAADPLVDVARRWKQHLNEDAKTCAYAEEIPEMNHNSVVGLEYPEGLGSKTFFLILESKYNHPRNKIRQNILTQILSQRRIPFETVNLEPSGSMLTEIFQMLVFGDYVAYYLSILNNVDPETVEMIHFLKTRLSQEG